MYQIIMKNAAINPKSDLPLATLLVLEGRIKARLKGLLAPIEEVLHAEGGTIVRDVAAASIIAEGFTPVTAGRIMALLQESMVQSHTGCQQAMPPCRRAPLCRRLKPPVLRYRFPPLRRFH